MQLESHVYKNVYANNVKSKVSFNDGNISIEKAITLPKSALFYPKNHILYDPYYKCKVYYIKLQKKT